MQTTRPIATYTLSKKEEEAIKAVLSGQITYREAGEVLGVFPNYPSKVIGRVMAVTRQWVKEGKISLTK